MTNILSQAAPATVETVKDTIENMKESGKQAFAEVKNAAKESLVPPVQHAGQQLSQSAQESARALAAAGRSDLQRLEQYITENPGKTAGIAFGLGLVAGIFFFRR